MSKFRTYFKSFITVLKNTVGGFAEFKILKISASLAYITVFSLAPLLLVVLFIFDVFWGKEMIEDMIFNNAKDYVGASTASQLREMIQNLTMANNTTLSAAIGIGSLVFGATSLFAEIQDSINTIWGVRPKKHSGLWLFIKNRLLSFGVIGSLGFIMLVALGFSTLLDSLQSYLTERYSDNIVYVLYGVNILVTMVITSLLFAAIFVILPDAKIKWRQVRLASITTTLLFLIGKFGISFYITSSNINTIYGAAGSIVILMLWVYYSSVILYLGATFAKFYAIEFSTPIQAAEYAEIVQKVEVASDSKTLQEEEQKKPTE
ncbi:YihY/virulence factor BrkB family protein [Flavobacterium ardleyense]|uniref:YihY/virulence factor BrkB family protein n=1 Tax=Flavobacterium ardleyense TaxID=2038737 RepID=A0ABW5Z352_9FLAO